MICAGRAEVFEWGGRRGSGGAGASGPCWGPVAAERTRGPQAKGWRREQGWEGWKFPAPRMEIVTADARK